MLRSSSFVLKIFLVARKLVSKARVFLDDLAKEGLLFRHLLRRHFQFLTEWASFIWALVARTSSMRRRIDSSITPSGVYAFAAEGWQ